MGKLAFSAGRIAAAFLLGTGTATFAAATNEAPRRIVTPVDSRDVRVVRGSVPGLTKQALDLGRVESTLALDRVALVFRPLPAQQRDLETLLAEQQDPRSPNHERWLSPDEFASRFGMNDADLSEVRAWLRLQGLTALETSRSRNEISFRGTAAQIENAFRTEIHRYRHAGQVHFANAGEPSVPAAFADSVLAIRNLSDLRPKPRLRVLGPRFTSEITGNHFLAPDDFATIYGVDALYDAGYEGTGQRIAVVGQTALGPDGGASDVDAFRAASGLPAANLLQILVPRTGSATVCADDVIEAHLDVEWSGAIARNATIVYVYTGVRSGRSCATTSASVWDALQHAVANDLAPVISMSYGACEAANGAGFARMVRGWIQQANAQGQTVIAASGDLGAADCEPRDSSSATSGLAVDVPASIPEATGVGGTGFFADLLDPDSYWSDTNNGRNGSAMQYIPETAWNDTVVSLSSGSGFAASGGGASRFFAKPSWQTGAGVPADGSRDVPDLALAASANHDGYLICSQGSCVNGFRDADLFLTVIGGSSASAPSLAGIVALILGGSGSSGLGNINPLLYALTASAPSAFHDVTDGTNMVPCSPGSRDCPTQPPYELGFEAGAGYDQVTGLGAIDAFALADRFAEKVSTATTLAASSPLVAPGSSLTLTATVTPLSSGTGSPTGGSVQFSIDGAEAGDPVAVSASGGAYRASYGTGPLASGSYSVSAEYLGNLSHRSSSASPVSVGVADFSLMASPESLTLAPGGVGSSTVTVASADGFAGSLSLACTPSASSAGVGCSLSPASLSLDGGSSSQTATLSITTTAASTASARGGSVLVAALLVALPARRRGLRRARALALLAFVGAAASCGGGGGGGGDGAADSSAGTPLGSYSIEITATSGAISHASSISLTVR